MGLAVKKFGDVEVPGKRSEVDEVPLTSESSDPIIATIGRIHIAAVGLDQGVLAPVGIGNVWKDGLAVFTLVAAVNPLEAGSRKVCILDDELGGSAVIDHGW